MLRILFSSPSLLRPRSTAEDEEARIEALRVTLPLAYGCLLFSIVASSVWLVAVLASDSPSQKSDFLLPLAFGFLAVYEVYFIWRAKLALKNQK
jgi:hypothetical protein